MAEQNNRRADLTNKFMQYAKLRKQKQGDIANFSTFKSEYAKANGLSPEQLDKEIADSSSWTDSAKTAGLAALDTASFGFGDDIVGQFSPEMGEEMRRRMDVGEGLDPWSNAGGTLAGAFMPGMGALGAAKLGVRGAAKVAGNTARYMKGMKGAAAAGAASGTTYGVGSMEPEARGFNEQTLVKGLEGGVMGAAGGVAGNKVGDLVTAGMGKLAPAITSKAKKALSSDQYDAVLGGITLSARDTGDFAEALGKRLGKGQNAVQDASEATLRTAWRGKMDDIVKRSRDVLDSNGNVIKKGETASLKDFNTLISSFGQDIGKASQNKAQFAQLVRDKGEMVDEFTGLLNKLGRNSDELMQAKKTWTQAIKLEALENAIAQADMKGTSNFSQAGFPNAMKREAQRLLNLKNISWTPQERSLLTTMASDKFRGDMVKLAAKFAPKGGLTAMFGAGTLMYDPVVGGTLMAGGWMADKMGEKAVRKGADRLRRAIANEQGNTIPFLSATFGAAGADTMVNRGGTPPTPDQEFGNPLELLITRGRVGGN